MHNFSILVDSKPFTDVNAPGLQSALALAHKKNKTFCRCQPHDHLPLVIKIITATHLYRPMVWHCGPTPA